MTTLLRFTRALGLIALLSFSSQPSVKAAPIVTGGDAGVPAHVRLFPGPGQAATRSFFAYPDFFGGVRVALGDVNGDGTQDIITAPGSTMGPLVKVFDGNSGATIWSFNAYDAGYALGVNVAAGDINGDGKADIITGADATTSQVKIFSGANLDSLGTITPYGASFSGGVRVATGDVNGDGVVDIITGPVDGSPHVKAFHGRTRTELMSFIAYPPPFNGGVFVASGDVNGDGSADIITGAGPNGGPHVKVFRGRTGDLLRSFFAYEEGFNGGVRVATGDVNNDGRIDIITAPAAGRSPQIKAFNGRTGASIASFFAYDPSFTQGVFVGSMAQPPILVTTNPATDITVTDATLHGTVDANGRTVDAKFQYGLTTSYGKTVAATPAQVSGTNPTAISAVITGLKPAQTYHFRAVASDGLGGNIFGEDRTFSTATNKAPSGGTFTVTPPSPVPAGTILTGTFADWIDEDGHTPLNYEIREGNKVIAPASEDATRTFILSPGTHILTGWIYDSLGAVTESVDVEVVVEGDPESEIVAASRDAVPGAGSGGIPDDATWKSFGVPAIAEGSVKYLANFVVPTTRGGGIFSNETPVVLIGDPVPGAGGGGEFAIPAGALFKQFKDPVTDAGGHVAFIATMIGAGITASNDTIVVSNARTGALEVIAREGSAAPGADGARYASFLGVSVGGTSVGGTIFTARLSGAQPTNNQGAWWLPEASANVVLLVRKGVSALTTGETVKGFSLLQAWPGTPGHGRGQIDGNEALLRVTLSGGKEAQVLATPGALDAFVITGDPIGGSSVWARMAQPSSGNGGQFLSVRGTFRPESAPANSRAGTGILTSTDGGTSWTPLATVGGDAVGTDGNWIDLGYPVNSSTSADVAFLGKARGPTTTAKNDSGVWWKSGAGGIRLLAQEGTQAVGCAVGERFATFRSLALPGGTAGPLFVAKLASSRGTVNAGNDVGVWTVDSSGSLRLLFREGQAIDTKKIQSFTFLSTVTGSPGVTRAFNENKQVTWRAMFTDGTTGIVVTQIP